MSQVLELRQALGITQQQLAHSLRTSVQTISRWERQISDPGSMARERLDALEELVRLAREVLDRGHVQEWFTAPNELLGGLEPLDAMRSPGGIEKVRDLLGRIKWGISA